MAEETHMPESIKPLRKRKSGHKKGNKAKKKQKQFQGIKERVKIDPKMKKFLRKKARDYNSDDEEEDESAHGIGDEKVSLHDNDKQDFGIEVEGPENEDEDDEIQPGITKFSEGCRAFRIAFMSIMKKSVSDDSLGPVLSGHEKLVAEKLAEEDAERKVKREAKKEKQLVGEKGHVKPANYLDSHEKFLIGVATKGVVKLFNAVNKAQNAQKGLDPSRTKDAKIIKKRRKEAYFSELGKTPASDSNAKNVQVHKSSGPVDSEGPSWAPLRDNYMLTNSKLKDWDKMPDKVVADDFGKMSEDSDSDD
ncbi:RRP15-like protein isoform X1 [Manihot esculenta]|uniref:RRP15-like protein isoform X1 n=1 Tax=Manihot esculenta TaxID=3983 RepID=UPI000B5D8996|nr:RRP15-like protein isoform X1 [Manihot esculenta]XP_021631716.1 RRP15-like protein isoform X1 [Manihot esculenta]